MKLTKEKLLYEKWIKSIKIKGHSIDLHANPTTTDRDNILHQGAMGINIGVTEQGIVFIWDSKASHIDVEHEINNSSSKPIKFIWTFVYNKTDKKIVLGSSMKPGWETSVQPQIINKAKAQIKNGFPEADSLNGTIPLK